MFLRIVDVNDTELLLPIDDIKYIASHKEKKGFVTEDRVKIYSRSDFDESNSFFEIRATIQEISDLLNYSLNRSFSDIESVREPISEGDKIK